MYPAQRSRRLAIIAICIWMEQPRTTKIRLEQCQFNRDSSTLRLRTPSAPEHEPPAACRPTADGGEAAQSAGCQNILRKERGNASRWPAPWSHARLYQAAT